MEVEGVPRQKHTVATARGILGGMATKIPQLYFLSALIIIAAVLAFFILQPFLITLIFAAVLAVVLQPLYQAVLKAAPNSPGLSAFATMLVAVVCLMVPLAFIAVEVARDAEHLYVSLSADPHSAYAPLETLYRQVQQLTPGLSAPPEDLSASFDGYVKQGLRWVVEHVGGALSGIASLLLKLFVFIIALYYFLRDGAKLKRLIVEASPLSDADDQVVSDRLALAVNAVIRGSLVIALMQGLLTAIGFTIFGVPNSMLWGVVAALAALIPGIGTSLVLIPGIIYLFVTAPAAPAIGLLIWSVVAVGLVDNLLGPRLVGRGMQLHPLVVLLAVFGGLAFFGPAGVFLGPLIVSLLFALVSIYPRLMKERA